MRTTPSTFLLLIVLSNSAHARPGDNGTLFDQATSEQSPTDKKSRTPEQRKISSPLLREVSRLRDGDVRGTSASIVKIDDQHRALVDVRSADVALVQTEVVKTGGVVVSVSDRYQSVTAWVPLLALEPLAAFVAVRAIEPAVEPMMSVSPSKR